MICHILGDDLRQRQLVGDELFVLSMSNLVKKRKNIKSSKYSFETDALRLYLKVECIWNNSEST